MHTLSAAGRIPAVLPETSHHGQTTKTSALQRRSEYSNDANNTPLRYGKGKCVAFHRASESGHVCSRIRTAETSLLPLCSTSRTKAAAAGLAGFLCPAAKYFSCVEKRAIITIKHFFSAYGLALLCSLVGFAGGLFFWLSLEQVKRRTCFQR